MSMMLIHVIYATKTKKCSNIHTTIIFVLNPIIRILENVRHMVDLSKWGRYSLIQTYEYSGTNRLKLAE